MGSQSEFDLGKPTKFGYGEYMTVCVFKGEYRKNENGIIDIEKTVKWLKEAELVLNLSREQA